MCSNIREEVAAVLDRLRADLGELAELDVSELTTPEGLAVLEHLEQLRRRLPVTEHVLINQIADHADASELGGKLTWAIADRLRITRGEAARRIAEAADLGTRRGEDGAPLEPVLPATAAAQHAGAIGAAHIKVIRGFLRQLPASVPLAERDAAEARLATLASRCRPDQLATAAEKLTDELAGDDFTDADRAARRSLHLGNQDPAGMTPIRGWLTPEARATLDPILAKWAAPGMCNPADLTPTLDGTPSKEAIAADTRTKAQRQHDALVALGRAMLASGQLGKHNGLPASIIVSASLGDIEAGTGKAHTGGGSWLPISDVIRMASHAHHYLRVFTETRHGVKELKLYHTNRLASPGQRIVLYARDRGCAHPGCPVPGYLTEAHHNEDYAKTGRTDIDDLSPRCGPHHKLLSEGGWKTRKRANGTIETLPPAHLDKGQDRTNTYHHPEKLLHTDNDRANNDKANDDDDDGEDPAA